MSVGTGDASRRLARDGTVWKAEVATALPAAHVEVGFAGDSKSFFVKVFSMSIGAPHLVWSRGDGDYKEIPTVVALVDASGGWPGAVLWDREVSLLRELVELGQGGAPVAQ